MTNTDTNSRLLKTQTWGDVRTGDVLIAVSKHGAQYNTARTVTDVRQLAASRWAGTVARVLVDFSNMDPIRQTWDDVAQVNAPVDMGALTIFRK